MLCFGVLNALLKECTLKCALRNLSAQALRQQRRPHVQRKGVGGVVGIMAEQLHQGDFSAAAKQQNRGKAIVPGEGLIGGKAADRLHLRPGKSAEPAGVAQGRGSLMGKPGRGRADVSNVPVQGDGALRPLQPYTWLGRPLLRAFSLGM